MRRDSIPGAIALLFILATISAFSFAYAALSQSLTINGEATVADKTSWSVKLENLSAPTITGDNAAVLSAPVLGDTQISDFKVKLTKPGDAISYTFDVTNSGNIDAKLSSLTIPTPTCTSLASVTADEALVCDNISYTLTYADGTTPAVNDYLLVGSTTSFKLTLKYLGDSSTTLPSNDVKITNLQISFVYAQK